MTLITINHFVSRQHIYALDVQGILVGLRPIYNSKAMGDYWQGKLVNGSYFVFVVSSDLQLLTL